MTALIGQLSLSVAWENRPEQGLRLFHSEAAFCDVWFGSALFAKVPVQVLNNRPINEELQRKNGLGTVSSYHGDGKQEVGGWGGGAVGAGGLN